MANGIYTLNNSGAYNFYSPTISSNYFDTAITSASTVNFGTAGFSQAGAVATPLGLITVSIQYSSMPYIRYQVGGGIAAGGSTYYAPTNYMIAGLASWRAEGVGVPLTSSIVRFGKLTNGETGYGFVCQASDGSLAVSQNYKSMYVHPDSSGNKLRTASASNNATPVTGNWQNQAGTYNQSLTQNITFDYPMDYPPLIFITYSDGPIALNGMIRDGNGKFVGASICAASGIGAWSGYGGNAAVVQNTYSFTYFLVSHQEPLYGDSSTYGMEVYDASGTRTFSSRFYVPSISKTSINLPYFYISGTYYSTYYVSEGGTSVSKTASQGVCINSFHSITNTMFITTFDYGGSGPGILTMAGRYLNVSSTYVTCTGSPTASLFAANGAITNIPDSVDFMRGNTTTTDVFFATYQT